MKAHEVSTNYVRNIRAVASYLLCKMFQIEHWKSQECFSNFNFPQFSHQIMPDRFCSSIQCSKSDLKMNPSKNFDLPNL